MFFPTWRRWPRFCLFLLGRGAARLPLVGPLLAGVGNLLYGLRLVGPANAARAVAYDLRRLFARPLPPLPQPRLPVGLPLDAEPTRHGARVHFPDDITLDLTFLAPDGVRLTWAPGPEVPDWGRPPWPEDPPAVTWEPDPASGLGRLRTARLEVSITPGGLVWRSPGHRRPFRVDPWPRPGPQVWVHRVPLHPWAEVYGLGLRARQGNLRPGTYRLWNRDPGGSYGPGEDPLYLSIPVVWVVQPRQWPYLWFYENPAAGTVRLKEDMRFVFRGGPAQAVLFVGPPRQVARRWAQYSGFPALPPRWALGFHQSRWGYRTQAEVEAVLEGYRARDLPLHALHLDIDHMDRRRVFTVDKTRFPDLAGLARRAAEQGVRLVPIVDPGVPADPAHPTYRRGREGGHFLTDDRGREVHAPVWPGWCAFPDFSRAATRDWWAGEYAPLWQWGAAGVWHDMNEPATFAAWGDPTLPLATRHRGEPPGDHRLYHNLYGLHMNMAGWDAQRRAHPDRRPWLLSRSGWAGVQRWAWNWSADLESTDAALALVVGQTVNLGLSGQPFSGPDIGGFSGEPSSRLFRRWFALAAWLPFFRLHSAIAVQPREPWRWPTEVQDAVRRALQARVRWMPYWYTLAWQAARFGWPLVRPLFWIQPRRLPRVHTPFAFLLGDGLLVSFDGMLPPRLRGWWLPLERIDPEDGPDLYLRAGHAVPTQEGDALVWRMTAASRRGRVRGVAYFDAGDGHGPRLVLSLKARRQGRRWRVRVKARGAYPFPYAAHRLRLGDSDATVEHDLPLPRPNATFTVEVRL
ncbi:MAG: glycoside hydrolase family 31 protein [Chloroflexi bacterium]|nr:glycoside hydrolase family 31 protein [Chloroflexota bacterium]